MPRVICHILLCFFLGSQLHSNAQEFRKLLHKKTDPALARKLENKLPAGFSRFNLYVDNTSSCLQLLTDSRAGNLFIHDRLPVISADIPWSKISDLIQSDQIKYIGEQQIPKEELIFGATDYSCNNIRLMQSAFPMYDGNNTLVDVKEHKPDSLDIDLKGRFVSGQYASSISSSHATIMSTLIGGAGNTWHSSLGVAPRTRISSASFMNLLPEPVSYYKQGPVNVQNHSYGTINQNFYGIEASAYDASVTTQASLLHVFSAGNAGNQIPADGKYAGIAWFSNMTGNFKQTKNILTVGHTDSFYHVIPVSSAGPAYDGRVKPELVAYGEDGSSGAAALVSGISLNLQQAYQSKNNGNLPPASLIKALLINGAKDVESPGIDFRSGYGSADAFTSMQQLVNEQYISSTIAANDKRNFSIDVPEGIRELKITLAWTDPEALPLSEKALRNDLDLTLMHEATQQQWLPWVLNSFPYKDSLEQLPVRKKDTLNNVEQISLTAPPSGRYTITIHSGFLATANQDFSMVYAMDSMDVFQWEYPTKQDVLTPNDSVLIRWKNTYNNRKGSLFLSVNEGQNWQLISNDIDLSKGSYRFAPADLFTKAELKMEVDNKNFLSDRFTIGQRIQTKVAYNCPDSFRIYWNKIPDILQYRIFQLGEKYLQSVMTTSDTSFGLLKSNSSSVHYAVAPVVNNQSLTRSYTFNYNTQGVDCYFKSFLSFLDEDRSELQLSIGSTYGLRAIRFEKRKGNGFETIIRSTNLNQLNFNATDIKLTKGTNYYRASLELINGKEINSHENAIYFMGEEKSIIYPNPLRRSGSLTILTDTISTFQIIDMMGRIVFQKEMIDSPDNLSLNYLQNGLYIYRFLQRNKAVRTGKLVIIE